MAKRKTKAEKLAEEELKNNSEEVNDEEVKPDIVDSSSEEVNDEEVKPETTTGINAILSKTETASLLSDPNTTLSEKLDIIFKKGLPFYSMIAAKIISYDEVMSANNGLNPKTAVNKQYDLLEVMRGVIETANYDDFKTKFDIINIGFINYKDGSFSHRKLYRFSEEWSIGERKLETFHNLIMLISTLADLNTRGENVKKLDIKKVLDNIELSETGIENLKKYYDL